jgi:hypothetical protein
MLQQIVNTEYKLECRILNFSLFIYLDFVVNFVYKYLVLSKCSTNLSFAGDHLPSGFCLSFTSKIKALYFLVVAGVAE